jgi:hypothetical protein
MRTFRRFLAGVGLDATRDRAQAWVVADTDTPTSQVLAAEVMTGDDVPEEIFSGASHKLTMGLRPLDMTTWLDADPEDPQMAQRRESARRAAGRGCWRPSRF